MAIDVPFTDSSISTNPGDGARDFVELVVGAAFLTGAVGLGAYGARRAADIVTDAAGVDNPTDDGISVRF